jgi:hypothetical protein
MILGGSQEIEDKIGELSLSLLANLDSLHELIKATENGQQQSDLIRVYQALAPLPLEVQKARAF